MEGGEQYDSGAQTLTRLSAWLATPSSQNSMKYISGLLCHLGEIVTLDLNLSFPPQSYLPPNLNTTSHNWKAIAF